MTEPQTITPEHLQALLDATSDTARLGLVEGRFEVLDGDAGDGALEVITRSELRDRLGDDPGDDELERQAATLTAVVEQLGG